MSSVIEQLPGLLWTLLVGGWIGFGLRAWGEQRRLNPTHIEFARANIASAKKLLKARRFVGDGPQITRVSEWRIEGLGCFRFTIEAIDPVAGALTPGDPA